MKILFILIILSLQAFSMSKAEISEALDAMSKSGQFSQEQIEEAKRELNQMSDEEFNEIKEKAMDLKDDPKIKEEAKKVFQD